jgi:hypothetical protein
MDRRIVYFEDSKPENTEAVFRLVQERLHDSGIRKVVLASTTGTTAKKAMDFFKDSGIRLIIVPHQFDFHREGSAFPDDLVKTIRSAGHEVHFGTMLFHTDGFYGSNGATVMANLLRCFCQGVKVCFEIVLMAADAGHVASGETVIAIAGTGRGSDTALVMQAASTQNMRKLKINEIICKPHNPLSIDELRGRRAENKG